MFNSIGLLKLTRAFFHYFESDEGKNSSDSIGSANKCRFRRAMLANLNITACTVDDIVNAIKSEMKDTTEKFEFCIVESFPEFERGKKRDELPINCIKELHSMYARDKTLYFLEESCLNCTVSTMCESCLDTPEAKTDDIAKGVPAKKKTDGGNQDDDNQAENIAVDEEDERNTDNVSDDESDADECADECLNIGDIIWGKHGRV